MSSDKFKMKKGEEKFSLTTTGLDELARRVLNTAPNTTPNIAIERLNSGVEIEQLEGMNVPVYKYQTQVTIHGRFPSDIGTRVRGYKSLVVNNNKTLGVKYVAIDAIKKATIEDALNVAEGKWNSRLNSQSFWVFQFVMDKQEAVKILKSTPDDLYIGSKWGFASMYGGYGIVMQVDAIYEKNLWKFINALCGIASEADLRIAGAERKARRERERNELMEQLEKRQEEREAKVKAALAPLRAEVEAEYQQVKYDGFGHYLQVVLKGDGSKAIKMIATRQGTFGRTLFTVNYFESVNALKVFLSSYKPEVSNKGTILKSDLSKLTLYKLPMSNGKASKTSKKDAPKAKAETDMPVGVTHEREWTWLKFTTKPSDIIIERVKSIGGAKFSGTRVAWYFTRHIEASVFADAGITF